MEDGHDLVVRVVVAGPDAELAADALWAAGATAVGLEGDDPVTLTASYPTPDAARVVAAEVPGAALVGLDPSWRDAWRAHAAPVVVGGLVVAPAWRDVPVGGAVVLRIDPGGVFGSGTHASTRLLLTALDHTPPLGLHVADVGCGSGVLSVAAARLGAASVTAVDVDPEAVDVTTANAEANGVGERVSASATPVAELTAGVDLALVNVTAGVHADLGPAVTALVRPGGLLLLAGLLPGQWRHVAAAYPGTEVLDRPCLDGWEGVVLRRAPLEGPAPAPGGVGAGPSRDGYFTV